ncbi:MAG: hypothetical protein F6K19_05455 [Cyanothece sp. SIO1E1]|nr:hypothetical protein [Cyanothece sp. SIO1E1]
MRNPLQKASVKRTVATITEKIDPYLEAGFLYFSNPIKTSYGQSGGGIYRILNGQLQREDKIEEVLRTQLKFGSRIFDVVKKFPAHTKVMFQFEKGEPAEVKTYSVPMLLEDIGNTMRDLLKKEEGKKAICQLEFFENGELELDIEGRIFTATGEVENTFFDIKDDAKCLYHALDQKVKKLRFVFDQGSLLTQADVPLPEYEITAVPVKPVVDVPTINNITTVFAYLESGNPEKINAALECIKTVPSFLERVECRYLSLLKARSNNPTIRIDAFPTYMLNRVDVKLLMERVFPPNHLNLAYLNRHESKVVVDFVGSLLMDCLDIEDFKREAIQTESESALQQLLDAQFSILNAGLQKRIEEYPESWMSQLYQKLLELKLEKVFFEKTLFSEANNSQVLEGFYLLLGLSSEQQIYIDIHQSEAPEIPEIIWMFRKVPRINWSQTQANRPKSPLKFSR